MRQKQKKFCIKRILKKFKTCHIEMYGISNKCRSKLHMKKIPQESNEADYDRAAIMRDLRDFSAKEGLSLEQASKLSKLLDRLTEG